MLIRGASGSGKTTLSLRLIERAVASGGFAWMVADDRTVIEPANGRLIARPPDSLAGLVERRGLGIARIDHERAAVLRLAVDIAIGVMLQRMPPENEESTLVEGVALPYIVVDSSDEDAVSLVLARLRRETHR